MGAHEHADIPVLIVDDQRTYRDVMRAVVGATPGLCVAAEAACGGEAMRALEEVNPRLALVDVRMPEMNGIELTRTMLERAPELVVLLVSAQPPPERLPADADGRTVPFVAKQDLCPSVLLELWRSRREPVGPAP